MILIQNFQIFLNSSPKIDPIHFKNSFLAIMAFCTIFLLILYFLIPKIRDYIKPLLMFSFIGFLISLALILSERT